MRRHVEQLRIRLSEKPPHAESTRSAFIDAMRGTRTGWWNDLIYTAPHAGMAHRYPMDIAAALINHSDDTGETFAAMAKPTTPILNGTMFTPR